MQKHLRVLCRVAVAVLIASAGLPVRAATDDENPRPATPRVAVPPEPPPAENVPPARLRHTAIYYVTGLGTPVGFVGLEGVHRLGSMLEISAGFGRGFLAMASQKDTSLSRDLQWAVMPRLRSGGKHHAFTIGAGLSGGNYGSGGEWFCDGPCPVRDYPLTYGLWGNAEVGTEHWWSGGFALRTFLGYARGCPATSCTSVSSHFVIPYFGLGLGYAF